MWFEGRIDCDECLVLFGRNAMRWVVSGICLGMLLASQSVVGQESSEPEQEARIEQDRLTDADSAGRLDDLDLREFEYRIQEREQALPMLWSAIYSLEFQSVDDAAAAESAVEVMRLKQRSEKVKDEIRELRAQLKRNAPRPASPAEARARAAELLRQAEEVLAQEREDIGETAMIRSVRNRLMSSREATQSRSGFSPPASSSRASVELMERIRNASSEQLERRVAEQGAMIRQLQEKVERLEKALEARPSAEDEESAEPE